jgi:hypothetical protein
VRIVDAEKTLETVTQTREDVPDNLPEAHTETEEEMRARVEAQIRAEYESMIDKRITGAQKKWEKKHEKEAAESLARVERLQMIENEQERERLAVKEHELLVRGTRLDIVDLIAEERMDPNFRNLIAYEDLLTIQDDKERYERLRERVIDLKQEFYKQVQLNVTELRKELLSGRR